MNTIGDYDTIMSDRNLFNQVVYTPLSDALRILEERQSNPELIALVEKILEGNIPQVLRDNKKSGVQFRQIATPNHDARHFISISKDFDLRPVFFEYLDDKFTSNNEFKHSLGQLRIQSPINKKNFYPIEKITVVDFNKHNGKKLKEVSTLWDEPLLDLHRRLFLVHDYNLKDFDFFDASDWFHENGGSAKNYYINFFLLFTCFGILFENFLTGDIDGEFSRDVVLPAIDQVYALTGVKPLIVPIGPLDMETDNHWISYHDKIKPLLNKN